MRNASLGLMTFLTSCTAAASDTQHGQLMDDIERQVQLPKDASKLSDYARYYAAGAQGQVIGIYLLPFGAPPSTGPCTELQADMTSREVPCGEMPNLNSLKAGQRRWLDNRQELPLVFDGGCSVVEVVYSLKARRIERVECNGVA